MSSNLPAASFIPGTSPSMCYNSLISIHLTLSLHMPPLLPQAHLVSTQPSRMSDYEMRAALTLCYDLLGGKKKLIFEQFT